MLPTMASSTPIVIATEQLHALVEMLGENPTFEQRAAVGSLAAQVEIAKRLDGIEKGLDVALAVRIVE
jgi:hypothetical protein